MMHTSAACSATTPMYYHRVWLTRTTLSVHHHCGYCLKCSQWYQMCQLVKKKVCPSSNQLCCEILDCVINLKSVAVPADYSYLPSDSVLNHLYPVLQSLSSECCFTSVKLSLWVLVSFPCQYGYVSCSEILFTIHALSEVRDFNLVCGYLPSSPPFLHYTFMFGFFVASYAKASCLPLQYLLIAV